MRIPPPTGPTGCPLFDRPDRDIVVQGLQDFLAMPSAGDRGLAWTLASRP